MFTIDETFDVGSDLRTGVDDLEYEVPFTFSGKIDKLSIKTGPSQMSEPEQKAATQAINDRANN